jgi:hypothetical protein
MIQRIQSLWLALAAISGGLAFQFPFYSGQRVLNGVPEYRELTATYNIPIIIFVCIAIVGALHAIFSYSKRKYQFTITFFSLIASIIAIVLMFLRTSDFEHGQLSVGCICIFLVPLFLFLGARGIKSDDKLVKSMDRLR